MQYWLTAIIGAITKVQEQWNVEVNIVTEVRYYLTFLCIHLIRLKGYRSFVE